jgi:hypothetical protein
MPDPKDDESPDERTSKLDCKSLKSNDDENATDELESKFDSNVGTIVGNNEGTELGTDEGTEEGTMVGTHVIGTLVDGTLVIGALVVGTLVGINEVGAMSPDGSGLSLDCTYFKEDAMKSVQVRANRNVCIFIETSNNFYASTSKDQNLGVTKETL